MKKIMVVGMAVCLALVGFSEKVMAGPVGLSAQESSQLSGLAGDASLLALSAGGSFPNTAMPLEMKETSSLLYLEASSPNLSSLKAGDSGAADVLVWVIVICVSVLLLRVVGIL